MVGLADENGRTYECLYGTYNKYDGFIFNDIVTNDNFDKHDYEVLLYNLFHKDMWKLKEEPEPKKMTHEDIERELGYRVQIVDPEPEEKKVSSERKKEIDRQVEMFKKIFGIELDAEDYY